MAWVRFLYSPIISVGYSRASRTTASKESGRRLVFALAPSLVWSPLHLDPVMSAHVSAPPSLASKAHSNVPPSGCGVVWLHGWNTLQFCYTA